MARVIFAQHFSPWQVPSALTIPRWSVCWHLIIYEKIKAALASKSTSGYMAAINFKKRTRQTSEEACFLPQ
jgi:hypothetical protein